MKKYIATLQHLLTKKEVEEEKKRKTMLGKSLKEADELYKKFKEEVG